jgi:hypothetical protein
MARIWQAQQVRDLGVRVDLVTAGSILGLGRTTSFELARRGEFPVPTPRLGRKYMVRVADLLVYLRIELPTESVSCAVPSASKVA